MVIITDHDLVFSRSPWVYKDDRHSHTHRSSFLASHFRMPAVTSGKVLVTGANGYIAFWVVKGLLEAGYSVRGTVRSESKVKYIKDYFKSYGDKLEVVVVEDIANVMPLFCCSLPSFDDLTTTSTGRRV